MIDDNTAPRPTPVAVRVGELCYGLYAWASFAVLLTVGILGVLVLPGLHRRRRWISAVARAWFAVAGIRVERQGFDRIPDRHCIVVANHASYLDGVILQAFLPPRFSFVIKGEMNSVPVAGLLLRRIGSHFVERFAVGASARDALRLLRAAAAGQSLAFFPEGTFHPQPGLHPFRPGAFAAAAKARLPVVPLAIRGSRLILPARRRLPRPARLELHVAEPIMPGEPAFASSATLADAARRRMLAVLGEPDLAAGPPAPAALDFADSGLN